MRSQKGKIKENEPCLYLVVFLLGVTTGVAIACLVAYAKAQNDSMENEWQTMRDKLNPEGKKEEGK